MWWIIATLQTQKKSRWWLIGLRARSKSILWKQKKSKGNILVIHKQVYFMKIKKLNTLAEQLMIICTEKGRMIMNHRNQESLGLLKRNRTTIKEAWIMNHSYLTRPSTNLYICSALVRRLKRSNRELPWQKGECQYQIPKWTKRRYLNHKANQLNKLKERNGHKVLLATILQIKW